MNKLLLCTILLFPFTPSVHADMQSERAAFAQEISTPAFQAQMSKESETFTQEHPITQTQNQPHTLIEFLDQHPLISGLCWVLLIFGPGIVGLILLLFGLRWIIRFLLT